MSRYATKGALVRIASATALAMAGAGAAQAADARYFSFVTSSGEPKIDANEFIVEVRDEALATQFQRMVANIDKQPPVAFAGKVVAGRAPYNEGWAFHVDPATLQPPSAGAVEVCAATPEYIEEHLGEVGGSFLPGGDWCPWDLHIVREVKR